MTILALVLVPAVGLQSCAVSVGATPELREGVEPVLADALSRVAPAPTWSVGSPQDTVT